MLGTTANSSGKAAHTHTYFRIPHTNIYTHKSSPFLFGFRIAALRTESVGEPFSAAVDLLLRARGRLGRRRRLLRLLLALPATLLHVRALRLSMKTTTALEDN